MYMFSIILVNRPNNTFFIRTIWHYLYYIKMIVLYLFIINNVLNIKV